MKAVAAQPESVVIRLFIIVPVYCNWGDTLECLRLLSVQDNRDFRVIVADDGSPEEKPDIVSCFEFVHYLRRSHAGFASICNSAAREAWSAGATHLLFLNNDTEFGSGFIGTWLRTIAALPEAILSPNVYWFDEPERIWFSGGRQSIWVPFFRFRREYRELTRVEIVSGCAMLTPSKVWLDAKGFDEAYVTYYEDFDFALKAKTNGVHTYIVPDVELRVFHKVSRSFHGTGVWKKQYRLLASRIRFIRRHYTGVRRFCCFALLCAQMSTILLSHPLELPRLRLLQLAVAEGLSGSGSGQRDGL